MSRLSKAIIGLGLLACVAALGYCFFVEHGEVVGGASGGSGSRLMICLAEFLAAVIVLALFGAYEVSHLLGERTETWVLQGAEHPDLPVPELEEAERLRKVRQPLEAIRLLREHLQKHPDELHVMARIAEIYRDDLHNFLAAALEYEELLQHKLPAEQWGWAALHLTTLYGRLNQHEKALALLERLERDYGQTLAAKRARERMAKARARGVDS